MNRDRESRRSFIYLLGGGGLLAAAYPVISALSPSSAGVSAQTYQPTPGDTLGPFYRRGAPRTEKLSGPQDAGTPLLVAGRVINTEGKPLSDASIEVFHADNSGEYDMRGFHLRGQIPVRSSGDYSFETIMPEQYGGRPRHIHYVVNAPNHRRLVTQLYFANDPYFGGNPENSYHRAGLGGRELIRPVTLIGHNRAQQASVVFDLCLVKG